METAIHVFDPPPRIFTGAGALDALTNLSPQLGRRAVVVTGASSMHSAGTLARTLSCLERAGVESTVYQCPSGEPTVTAVDAIRALITRFRPDFVIGLGGGSPLDAAKAAAGLANESDPSSLFLKTQRAARAGLPIVAIPTTSGTGAEATPNAVITDPAARLKASLRNGLFLPSVAIVDPVLTLSCPPRVTAYSGMDAIAQALESFVSIHATPLSDACSFESFRLLWNSLPTAYDDGSNLDARSACSYGSLLAGIALAHARLGAVHGIAHPLGARYSIPHGLACAALLPEVVRMNHPFASAKYERLSREIGAPLLPSLESLLTRLGIGEDFRRYRIPPQDFGPIADESLPSGSLKANPKPFARDDVIAVLKAVTSPPGEGA